ncbi:MAG: hypothetical protein ACR2FH_06910, partial [Caulobacteraceae bacterium]
IHIAGYNPIIGGYGGAKFTNAGTLEVDSGQAIIGDGVDLTNAGLVSVQSGLLDFVGAFANSGAGTISISSGAEIVLEDGGSAKAGAITLAAGATLFVDGGSSGSTFSLGAGTIGGAGTVALGSGELAVAANATIGGFTQEDSTPSMVSGPGTLTVTGAVTSANTLLQTGPGATVLEGASAFTGGQLCLDGSRTLENQGTFSLTGSGSIFLGFNPFGSSPGGGSIKNDASATLDIQGSNVIVASAGAAHFTNAGTLEKTGAGAAAIGVKVTDTGAVAAAGGTLDFTKAIGGDGTLAVDSGAILEVGLSAAASLAMTFSGGGGTLALGKAAKFAATINGFAATDIIDLLNTSATSATLGGGDRLVIVNGRKTIATLQLAGTYTGDTFNVAPDGNGGADITVTAGPAAAQPPAQGFIAAMAGLGAGAGGWARLMGDTRIAAFRPLLMAPRMAAFA